MKRRIIYMALCAVAVVGICFATTGDNIGYANSIDPSDMNAARAWGQIDSAPFVQDDEIWMQGDHIQVYADEIHRITQKYKANGVDDGETRAEDYVLRREVLYYAGTQAGFSASEQEVQQKIDKNIEMAESADGKEYFHAYLQEAGITSEEYWNSQREAFRKDIVIGKYLDSIRVKKNFVDMEKWQEYEAQLVKTLINAEHVKRVS